MVRFPLITLLGVLFFTACSGQTSEKSMEASRNTADSETISDPSQAALGLGGDVIIVQKSIEISEVDEVPDASSFFDRCVSRFSDKVPNNLASLKQYCSDFIKILSKPSIGSRTLYVSAFHIPSAANTPYTGMIRKYSSQIGGSLVEMESNGLGNGVSSMEEGLYGKLVHMIHVDAAGKTRSFFKSVILNQSEYKSTVTVVTRFSKELSNENITLKKILTVLEVPSDRICKTLQPGDAFYSNWRSCCDSAKNGTPGVSSTSYWVQRGQSSGAWYGGSCASWGVRPK